MFEASAEFLPELKSAIEWREPASGGQDVGALFFASFLWAAKEMKAPSGGATPGSQPWPSKG